MYHMVCPRLPQKYYRDGQKTKNYLRVEPEQFSGQISWLKSEGFEFFTMSEVLRKDLPERSVFLTFDDGFEDNYQYAFPILKQHNVPATIYLVVNRHHADWSTDRVTEQVSQELNDQPMLSHEQVFEMLASGLIEFGAHTLDHVRLNELTEAEATWQIQQSRSAIQQAYNINCDSFAYPFGYFDQQSIALVEKSGFSNACTTEHGSASQAWKAPYQIPRIMISGNDSLYRAKKKILKGS